MKTRTGVAFASLLMLSQSVWAVGSIDPNNIPGQTEFDAMAEDLTSALSYKAVAPAEPLGLLGFDIAAEVTLTEPANIGTWGQAIGDTSLNYIPLPKLHVHKGLPMNIDVGAVYSTVPGSNISYFGGELRYSIIGGNVALPAVAVRGTYTKMSGVDEIGVSTKGLEASVSKGFLMFTPYAGVGKVWGTATPSGTLDLLVNESDISQTKLFAGVNVSMLLVNLGVEWDKTGDANSYSVKLGLGF